ncbi:MAG: Clp protease N-terminal domain-containing protein, partial [Muribaculaceae bacterium]|nr:Clp protease N-terminal domain-containing protein [Muribaculaceae bacterium]
MKNDYSKQFRPILEQSYNIAQEFDSKVITSEHFVLAALRDENGYA